MLRSTLRYPYNALIRPHIPRKIGVLNGVAVRWPRLLDIDDHTSDWKAGTVGAVQETVSAGDTVVEIGGGFGVCTVWAAREAGRNGQGQVITYEAAKNRVDVIRETIGLNEVDDSVTVRHAVVGESVDVFGEMAGASEVPPSDLPEGDVLVMDCEGAELEILKRIREDTEWRPRELVVETHGFAGAPTEEVVGNLENLSYTTDVRGMASPHGSPEEDNQIVIGTRE